MSRNEKQVQASSASSTPQKLNTTFTYDVKAETGSEMQISPHGTVRSFRGTHAPSATMKTLPDSSTAPVPTALEPLQHSLPSAAPAKSGEVMIVDGQPLTRWDMGPQNRMRPITFKPNGSFKVLAHKLVGTSFHESRPSALNVERKSHIPGYTGFVRGKQHVQARTYGETTKRALSHDYRETVCTSPIPSDPRANRKIFHQTEEESFVSNTFAGKMYHVPGYTGFVPGVRSTFSKSYGTVTSAELQKHYALHGGAERIPAKTGFAETVRTRKALSLDSAPLPGAIKTHKPPEKLIPAHLREIRFLAY